MSDNQTAQTHIEDLRDSALKHYDEASAAVHHHDSFIVNAIRAYDPSGERFVKPTDRQLIEIAIIFNEGNVEADKLADMTGMCMFMIERLYDNGVILLASKREEAFDDEEEYQGEAIELYDKLRSTSSEKLRSCIITEKGVISVDDLTLDEILDLLKKKKNE